MKRAAAVAAVIATFVTGCAYFDSRWVQDAQENQRTTKRLRPASLGATPQGTRGGKRVALVRAYGSRGYATQTLDWEAQFEELLRDANRVFGPSLGVTLENGGTSLWDPESGEARPHAAIDDLARLDSGAGAHWVVGFLAAQPKLVTDFHQLGYARHFSKHLIVRGSTDPGVAKNLERFDHLSEAEREKIYSERRHHQIVAVFLHEVGHTLGGLHRTARNTLMTPAYDKDASSFDDASLGLFRVTLPLRFNGATPQAILSALADYLEKNPDGWVGSERADMLAYAGKVRERPTQPGRPTSPAPEPTAASVAERVPPPTTPLPLTTLAPKDQAIFDAALAREREGDPKKAWSTALPLFEIHPRVVEVQEMRCRLAKAQRFFAGVVEAHCERLVALGRGGS